MLHLTGGVGGYATAQAAYAALSDDGHGGSFLSFHTGTGGIDFVDTPKGLLSAANFQIG